jgi:membrane-associated protein
MNFVDLFIHTDKVLANLVGQYGLLTYLVIFIIIFLETAFVVTPFLPGDSLLFIAGTLAAQNMLNVYILFALTAFAAILGDSANYYIGKYVGEKFFEKNRLIKKEYIERTKEFYDKHGGKTIILARFIPIIRTFAPFVAGVGKMDYKRFFMFNVIGGILWTGLFLFAGYLFGNLSIVKDNLTYVIIIIIGLSMVPGIIEFWRQKRKN